MRDGEMVGSVSAQLNLPRTFALVLGSAHASQGEIPFAIDADGALHTASPAQKDQLTALNVAATRRSSVRQEGDWVIVTREAPSNITFGIARPIAQSLKEIQKASVRSLSLGLGVIALAVIGIVPLSRRMTRNLTTLTDGVQRIAQGDFSARVPVRSRDEFGALAGAFNQMARDVEHRQQLVVERERLKRELELCRRIQTEMLPHAPLRLGATEVKGISIPAREVGGDFFNYFELPGGDLAVLVGDVSGKGISAALLMANIQATLRARLPLEPDLARLTAAIDKEIEEATPSAVYATLFLAIVHPQAKTLRYVNAGHHPQFVIRGDGIGPRLRGADRAARRRGRAVLLHRRSRRGRERDRRDVRPRAPRAAASEAQRGRGGRPARADRAGRARVPRRGGALRRPHAHGAAPGREDVKGTAPLPASARHPCAKPQRLVCD
jgi:HAMP domain-containing protein